MPESIREHFRTARDHMKSRIEVMKGLLDLPAGPPSEEFHGSIRVSNLPENVRFYA